MNLMLCRTLGTLKGDDWNHAEEEEGGEEEGEPRQQKCHTRMNEMSAVANLPARRAPLSKLKPK